MAKEINSPLAKGQKLFLVFTITSKRKLTKKDFLKIQKLIFDFIDSEKIKLDAGERQLDVLQNLLKKNEYIAVANPQIAQGTPIKIGPIPIPHIVPGPDDCEINYAGYFVPAISNGSK